MLCGRRIETIFLWVRCVHSSSMEAALLANSDGFESLQNGWMGGLTAQPYVFASENKAKHEISWSLFSLLKN